jgi:hypothetical protein
LAAWRHIIAVSITSGVVEIGALTGAGTVGVETVYEPITVIIGAVGAVF